MNFTLALIASVVLGVLGLFGGYLTKLAPPIGNALLVIGFIQFILLIILLLILHYVKKIPKLIVFLLITIAVTSFIWYYNLYDNKVAKIGNKLQVIGETLTEEYVNYCKHVSAPDCKRTVIERLREEPVDSKEVWNPEEVSRNENLMIIIYSVIVLSICSILFLLMDRKAEFKSAGEKKGEKD